MVFYFISLLLQVLAFFFFLFSFFFHVCSWTWLRKGYIWFFVLQDEDSRVFTFPLLCTVSCIFINNMFLERISNWNVINLSFLVISNLGLFLSLLTLFCICSFSCVSVLAVILFDIVNCHRCFFTSKTKTHFWEKMQTPSPSTTVPLLLLPKQRPTTKPAPQTTILHLVTWNQFFLMTGKSTNLFVTKRKGELIC